VALSYVWGGIHKLQLTKSTAQLLETPGALKTEDLPATVADAIEVTRALGERYIWVDALCIIQDDELDKQRFISNMDIVYQKALLTIVAMSGENSDAGLAGIRPKSRSCEQHPFKIKGGIIVESLDSPQKESWRNYLGASRWDRRAWTFQEKIFSSRSLIFTSKQIYWECLNGSWCEDGIWEVFEFPSMLRRAFDTKPHLRCQSMNPKEFPDAYGSLVEQYSAREFSFDFDILNAFAGILNFMERVWDQEFFWGMPCAYFSAALQWVNDYGEFNKAVAKTRPGRVPFKLRDGRLLALPPPSWSWAGWKNKISTPTISAAGRAIEVVFHHFTETDQLAIIAELSDSRIADENTQRSKWKDSERQSVNKDDLPAEVLTHPFRHTFLVFWSSSSQLLCNWHLGHNGRLFPNLGWAEGKSFRCCWKQKPPFKAVVTEDGTGFQLGEAVLSSVVEAVVIGRDVTTRVGGCGDMLVLMILKRIAHIAYRFAVVGIPENEWLELPHTWNLFFVG
jgi:hypothetical protein